MITLQTAIFTGIIIVLFVQYCRAATKARSLHETLKTERKTMAGQDVTISNLRFAHECDLQAMKRRHKVQEEALRSLRHTLNGQSTIKCLTFQTRAGGLKRYTVGHNIARIKYTHDDKDLTVTCFKDNGSSSETIFKMADLTGPIHVDRGE